MASLRGDGIISGTIPTDLAHPTEAGTKLAYWEPIGRCVKGYAGNWPGGAINTPFSSLAKWRATAKPPKFPTPEEAAVLAPSIDVDMAVLHSPPAASLRATWMGHAAYLVQVSGVAILTDPVWSERCAPVQFAGPKRFVPPPIKLDQLPKIDVVTISHNHYDHLDHATVKTLIELFEPTFVVPLGMKSWFKGVVSKFDYEAKVVELDWWKSCAIPVAGKRLHVTAVPVQHWTMRSGPWDRNTQLWCGFVYEVEGIAPAVSEPTSPALPVISDTSRPFVWRAFHCGDTGYSDVVFKHIGAVFKRFDLAMIPIGAYHPRWFLSSQHVDPEQAVQIHTDLNRPRKSVGMHWGTFILTDEPIDEPPKELAMHASRAGLPEDEFVALRHGEAVTLPPLPVR